MIKWLQSKFNCQRAIDISCSETLQRMQNPFECQSEIKILYKIYVDHLAFWACPNEILFNTVRWILIWIKKGVQNSRDEGCVQGGGSSEKEQEVKEDKRI